MALAWHRSPRASRRSPKGVAMTITPSEQRTDTLDRRRRGAPTGFAVKTFWGLATVRGGFDRFDGSYEVGPDGPKIELTIDADSLDTGNKTRDRHLRSTDFFRVDEHPPCASIRRPPGGRRGAARRGPPRSGRKGCAARVRRGVQPVESGLEIEATTTVDQRQFGMSSGRLGMIRPPATLHVKARVHETNGILSKAA